MVAGTDYSRLRQSCAPCAKRTRRASKGDTISSPRLRFGLVSYLVIVPAIGLSCHSIRRADMNPWGHKVAANALTCRKSATIPRAIGNGAANSIGMAQDAVAATARGVSFLAFLVDSARPSGISICRRKMSDFRRRNARRRRSPREENQHMNRPKQTSRNDSSAIPAPPARSGPGSGRSAGD